MVREMLISIRNTLIAEINSSIKRSNGSGGNMLKQNFHKGECNAYKRIVALIDDKIGYIKEDKDAKHN